MTTATDNLITIQILDRKYNIKCPAHEVLELQEAAKVVQNNMKQLKQSIESRRRRQISIYREYRFDGTIFDRLNNSVA